MSVLLCLHPANYYTNHLILIYSLYQVQSSETVIVASRDHQELLEVAKLLLMSIHGWLELEGVVS